MTQTPSLSELHEMLTKLVRRHVDLCGEMELHRVMVMFMWTHTLSMSNTRHKSLEVLENGVRQVLDEPADDPFEEEIRKVARGYADEVLEQLHDVVKSLDRKGM
ncbi:MAG: hypothetical protein OXG06_00300 [Gammaproteobacteria bacterium]|nr:hypothetical protein [Gammaproteobacteria bacterium]